MTEAPSPSWESKQVNRSELIIVGYQIERMPQGGNLKDEIVEYNGKKYKVQGAAQSPEGFDDYNALFKHCDARGEDWFVVKDFTSEQFPRPTPVVFVELKTELDANVVDRVYTYNQLINKIQRL